MSGLTYDTGALIAADRLDRAVWVLHRRTLERGMTPTVPAGVLAQAWRGDGRQANLARFLRPCDVEPLDEFRARTVAAALSATGTADVIDASVVVGAALRNDAVVTSDAGDLRVLASALQVDLAVVEV